MLPFSDGDGILAIVLLLMLLMSPASANEKILVVSQFGTALASMTDPISVQYCESMRKASGCRTNA
jgi:hypothetical protein